MKLLTEAKINPKVIAILFRRLSDEVGVYNENFEFLMSHPHNNSRIKAALSYPLPKDFKSHSLQINWEIMQEKLESLNTES